MALTVCSYKFACYNRSGLNLLGKVVANISLEENTSSPTITKGRGSSLLGGGLELGILSLLDSGDFPKTDLVKSPPSLKSVWMII